MRGAFLILLLACVVCISGCTTFAMSPVVAALTLNERGPCAVGDTSAAATRVGLSKAEGILLVAWGDASIETAAQHAGITRIHHVDSNSLNVLGIYARYETIVYGQ